MAASTMITQRDVVAIPQYIIEGTTVALYGVTPADPTYTAFGQNATMVKDIDPTTAEKRISGNIDRQEKTKTREKNSVTVKMLFMTGDEAILAHAQNLPNGAGTPDESWSLLWSYNDDQGNETFEQFLGCKPNASTLSQDSEGYLTLEVTYSVKTVTIDTSGPTLGSGALASVNAGTPLIHSDGGASAFVYNSVAQENKAFSITVTLTEAIQDASGTTTDLYRRPTQRVITGSIDLFKEDDTLDALARAVTPQTGAITIDTGQIVGTLTRMIFMPSAEEIDGDKSDATIETKSFEADVLVWA